MLASGRAEGTVGPQITSGDIIIMGALLAQPLPYVPDWEQTARRAARIYLAGLAPASVRDLPGTGLTRADLEADDRGVSSARAGDPRPAVRMPLGALTRTLPRAGVAPGYDVSQ